MTHLINRLQFELNCTDEDQAFNFRQNFGIIFQEQIINAADEICSSYVQEDEWIQIEKLEIEEKISLKQPTHHCKIYLKTLIANIYY